ncbi:MAG: hypothetical protein ACFFED_01800 [Candidatus Thorarchaeota archaeon]
MQNGMLSEQKAIFSSLQGSVINPDNTDGYKEAKDRFDAADKAIKALEKQIAELLLLSEAPEKSFLDEIVDKFKKSLKSNDRQGSMGWSGVRG